MHSRFRDKGLGRVPGFGFLRHGRGSNSSEAESPLEESREPIVEFYGLESSHTNLPFFMWVQPSMGACHDVRVGVSRDWNVRRAERDLALLRRWVDLNRDMIVKYWNSEEIVL